MVCASRSTATTARFLSMKIRACLPDPLATSSTGPRFTSGAQRTTHSDGDSGPIVGKKRAQDRAVAAAFIRAVAADREIAAVGKQSEQLEQPLRLRPCHFASVEPFESLPVARLRELDQLRARRQLGQPK